MATQIGTGAIVSPTARLGENVTVGPYSIVGDEVEIGDGTAIGSHVVVHKWTKLGVDCRVASFASVGGPPQDLKFAGEKTTLIVGDRCDIREYVTMNRGTMETGSTVIGSDCLLMANVHVGHDCRVGNHCIFANSVALGGHVHVGDYAIIGGLTPVHQFVAVGAHVMIGGGFRTTKDVPPYIRAGREPLSFEGLNAIGLRRRGFAPDSVKALDAAYTLLYLSNLNVSQAVERIKAEVPACPEVAAVLEFIASSKRGILPARGHHA